MHSQQILEQTRRPPRWHGLSFVPLSTASLLDVGCNVGENLEYASKLGISELYGIEINEEAIAKARTRLAKIANCSLVQGSADQLPFNDQSIETAICLEVLEHIPTQLRPKVMQEIYRVLKKNGVLVVSVPAAGVFAFLDPANMRFRIPGLYHALSRFLGGGGREQGFQNQKHGVVWHHHFKYGELKGLLQAAGFELTIIRSRGSFLAPIVNWMQFPFYRLKKFNSPFLKLLNRMIALDMSLSFGEILAYNVIMVAKK